MSEQKISLRTAFDEAFGKEDKYFGEWFIKSDESLTDFLENNINSKEIFFKQLRYLYLYLESLEILKKQAVNKDWTIANVVSKETWYCCVLLLLIGLIDQHTKKELRPDGKIKSQKERFQIVMNSLTDEGKRHTLNHYGGNVKYKTFDEITAHLYGTRNFFAHEIILPSGAIPQDGFLAFSDKNSAVMYLNMPHGRIFLTIVIALIRYFGFVGKIEIASNKKFDGWSDMLRSA
jgi:hypothetical protein